MTPFERSVEFWLRAYPLRWRAARSAEVAAVLADLAGPAPHRLDARAALGLVRGGWATRWREHPPLGAYLRYRLVNWRLPAQFDGWVRDERAGHLIGLRSEALPFLCFVTLVAGGEGGLRHLGWVTWSVATRPEMWVIWAAIVLVRAIIRTVGPVAWLEVYLPTSTDAPGHFGPYVELHAHGTSGPAAPVMRHRGNA